jgi:hypothetical protein
MYSLKIIFLYLNKQILLILNTHQFLIFTQTLAIKIIILNIKYNTYFILFFNEIQNIILQNKISFFNKNKSANDCDLFG